MDIIDEKPTCGCMSRFFAHSDAACALAPGHIGRHRATSGGVWNDDMAVWPTDRIRTAIDANSYLRAKIGSLEEAFRAVVVQRDRAAEASNACHLREHDLLSHLDLVIKERDESRRDAAMLRTSLDATQAELEQARHAADEWAAKAREYDKCITCERTRPQSEDWAPVCGRSKAKQVGSSSFVVRRCKLADGHDGQCEPA